MQDTRQQILEILKRHGEVTVRELSHELGLTSVTVRHHLEILRSEGYITEPEIRRSSRPGRPRYVYRLTSTAADLFPNNYSGLAGAMLDALKVCMSPEEQQTFLRETAKWMVADVGNRPTDRDTCMDSALAFMNQHGFVARWDKNREGRYFIYVSGCPYHHVAQAHTETCQIDQFIIKQLTGAEPQRTQGTAQQGGLCVYEVIWND
ncbi:MAG TPA: ArsR family transcriptional regulator [Anaerolineae bacterium]|nr:ArsR family transcriptional regulator [Anaerolineae bacterium]HQH37368.1 ArsR family transcriptional regulator [Anaerolineae bacterium]